MLTAGAHLLWQVRQLKINDAANCLMLFRANSVTGGLTALSFAAAAWFG
jgi:4-hydroxybenzoate polyprenyltransferase